MPSPPVHLRPFPPHTPREPRTPWRFCKFLSPVNPPPRTSGAWLLVLIWAPRIPWWLPCKVVWRAAYLCELQGAPLRAHDNTAMPLEFLQQQIAWREALEDAHDGPALEALHQELEQARSATLARCAELLDVQQDAAAAAQQVRALMFVARLLQNVEQRLDQLTP